LNHLSCVDEVQGDKVTNEVQTAKTNLGGARASIFYSRPLCVKNENRLVASNLQRPQMNLPDTMDGHNITTQSKHQPTSFETKSSL
jgi:hypothetical protein